MEKDQLDKIKYREFYTNPAYSLFLYILNNEKQDIVRLMLGENDKDKLFIYKKQIDALTNLESSIQSKIQTEEL